eukprot:jgi/Ulvmu1/5222/UM022_0015.1
MAEQAKKADEFSLEEDDLFEDFELVNYKPGGAEAEEQLWDEAWDGEGDDGDFKAILKEELAKAKKK